MFYSLSEYVDAIWAYSSRTVDAGTPAASDGTYLDDVGYAVWTYPSRTDDGGVSTNLIAVPLASGTTVGTPELGQTHALTAQGLRSGSSVGTPAIGQTHALTGNPGTGTDPCTDGSGPALWFQRRNPGTGVPSTNGPRGRATALGIYSRLSCPVKLQGNKGTVHLWFQPRFRLLAGVLSRDSDLLRRIGH